MLSFSSYAQEKNEQLSLLQKIDVVTNEANSILVTVDITKGEETYDVNVLQSSSGLFITLKQVRVGEKFFDEGFDQYGNFDFFPNQLVRSLSVMELADGLRMNFNGEGNQLAYLISQSDQQLIIHLQKTNDKEAFVSGHYEKTPLHIILMNLIDGDREQIMMFEKIENDTRLWLSNIPQSQILDLMLDIYQLNSIQHDNTYLLGSQETLNRLSSGLLDKTYTEDRVTLTFQNLDVISLLQVLSEFSKQALITNDADLGELAVRVKDMPWRQVLDYVAIAKGLEIKEVGDFLIVAYPEEIALAQEKGCFAQPIFQGATYTSVSLENDPSDVMQEKIQMLLNDMYDPQVCSDLNRSFEPFRVGYYRISFYANAETTEKIKQLIAELDKP